MATALDRVRSRASSLLYYNVHKHVCLGGPDTMLPRFVESLLCWGLALFCLTISGYYWMIQTVVIPFLSKLYSNTQASDTSGFSCWLPLTTCSRREISEYSNMERYQQLVQVLEVQVTTKTSVEAVTDDELVQTIQSSDMLRRLTSLALRPTRSLETHPSSLELGRRLVSLWPRLLQIPKDTSTSTYPYPISLIVPAFKEEGPQLVAKLEHALQTCRAPNQVQLILINAGHCSKMQEAMDKISHEQAWAKIDIVHFTTGGGRGPCLNFGASHAKGRVYTFLHSDTHLPSDWDVSILHAFTQSLSSSSTTNACAFSFGIDKSNVNHDYCPPGIEAVETTANLRTHWYHLPYGDQCLSVPQFVFQYVGGFPDQCLMEDYELIGLLRKRVALLYKFGLQAERLQILPDKALCSPRRWQRFGVLFVTFTNSKCVSLYAGGMTPDDLFRLYYGQSPPARTNDASPWECDMHQLLETRQQ
jgi:hypothetical protein